MDETKFMKGVSYITIVLMVVVILLFVLILGRINTVLKDDVSINRSVISEKPVQLDIPEDTAAGNVNEGQVVDNSVTGAIVNDDVVPLDLPAETPILDDAEVVLDEEGSDIEQQVDRVRAKLTDDKLRQLKYMTIIDFSKITELNCESWKVYVDNEIDKTEVEIRDTEDDLEEETLKLDDIQLNLTRVRQDGNETMIDDYEDMVSEQEDDVQSAEDKLDDKEEYLKMAEYTKSQLKVLCII